jgi:hypothetical protein
VVLPLPELTPLAQSRSDEKLDAFGPLISTFRFSTASGLGIIGDVKATLRPRGLVPLLEEKKMAPT